MAKITVSDIIGRKNGKKISVLTAYDYSFASIFDQAGVDIVLVGDSMANVVLGLDKTPEISFEEMLNHTKAVARAVTNALVVADMPYESYQQDPGACVTYAQQLMAAGADAVKIEWFDQCIKVMQGLTKHQIPVMGHVGLTPQTVDQLGGYKVQGKTRQRAKELVSQAKAFTDTGIFSIVLECMPYQLSQLITKEISVPTIGCGAGPYCDGQVLVSYDFLGLYPGRRPSFARVYKNLTQEIKAVARQYCVDVENSTFPNLSESFSLAEAEIQDIDAWLKD